MCVFATNQSLPLASKSLLSKHSGATACRYSWEKWTHLRLVFSWGLVECKNVSRTLEKQILTALYTTYVSTENKSRVSRLLMETILSAPTKELHFQLLPWLALVRFYINEKQIRINYSHNRVLRLEKNNIRIAFILFNLYTLDRRPYIDSWEELFFLDWQVL